MKQYIHITCDSLSNELNAALTYILEDTGVRRDECLAYSWTVFDTNLIGDDNYTTATNSINSYLKSLSIAPGTDIYIDL